jgi:nucleoside 2-deoxyribosyltransferase
VVELTDSPTTNAKTGDSIAHKNFRVVTTSLIQWREITVAMKEAQNVALIVGGDLQDICTADVILVNASRPSWGTAMEIVYAHILGKRIVAFCDSDFPSPWLVYHATTICKTFDECFLCV